MDVHRLVTGRALLLGGVHIPYETGLLGHSDADVLLHAVSDALLGAAALGDIGALFPDTDPQYAGATPVAFVACRTGASGCGLQNYEYRRRCLPRRRKTKALSRICGKILLAAYVTPDDVSVTPQRKGAWFYRQLEGIAAHAVCLIEAR